MPAELALPLDRERPPVTSFLRETVTTTLPPEIRDRLRAIAAEEGASNHAVLLAAFAAVLFRYTSQTEVELGCLAGARAGSRPAALALLRLQATPTQTARELIRAAEAALRRADDAPGAAAPGTAAGRRFSAAFLYWPGDPSNPGGAWDPRGAAFGEELAACDLSVLARDRDGGLELECDYDAEVFDPATLEGFLGRLGILAAGLAKDPGVRLADLPLLTPAELRQVTVEWNRTGVDFPRQASIHHLFEEQAARTPDAVAAIFRDGQLTYGQLDARANRWARALRRRGVGPDVLVGICAERSLDMIVGLLGILKAGGAYVPMDPAYPRDRIQFMIQDAGVSVLLTQRSLREGLPATGATVLCLDEDIPDSLPDGETPGGADADSLAYVIYTSGSTGKPKGVMVTHRNVVNFFSGMDRAIGFDGPGVWLAVTSISFDISVLELFWTLARGFTIVLYAEDRHAAGQPAGPARPRRRMDFSLFYFSSDAGQDPDNRYRLLLDGARFADRHGFAAVWTPERHFHAFGGLYPNPSVTGAAVAAITERVKIRAGSVVMPLQNPLRVAEEWSVVDNLSRGRVGVSFASGWQVNDFVLAPQNYAERKEVMVQGVETVRKLWRGEAVTMPAPNGNPIPVRVLPRPVQAELPIWLTATGNPETFRAAGRLGTHLLTHLVGQKIEDLAEKIAAYRAAWREAGHAGEGQVTLMLHTFVGDNLDEVRETVRRPFSNYLKTSIDLLKHSPWGFAPARLSAGSKVKNFASDTVELSDEEMKVLLDHAFEQYFTHSSLFGTPEVCLQMVDRLRAIGVDEIACLVDFGVESQVVLDHLRHLAEVKDRAAAAVETAAEDYSLAALISRHQVTHLQCTPSMARMLVARPDTAAALGLIRKLMIGGEAFPPGLAGELSAVMPRGVVHNMYGPTETAIWSTTQAVEKGDEAVTIGRPIANTQVYLLDANLQLVPPGLPGELCIGGLGVTRGYWNRPELTRERFVADPWSPAPGARLYRTGDLARHLPDGRIQFLGRIDHQVKIRGYRIEVGEIEALLNEHPGVRESVAVAREDVPGDKRLVAYVCPRPGHQPKASELRQHLKEKLPDYMMPSHLVFLEKFPQTPNGKIDRKALPAPDKERPDLQVAFEAPRGPVEEALAGIWAEQLGVERVGRGDNFFELGGHSLLAVRLFAAIKEKFGRELPLSTLFQARTLADLAAMIHQEKTAPPSWSSLVAIQAQGSKAPFFAVHGGGGNVLFYRDLAAHCGTDRPFCALQSQGLDGKSPHLTTVEDMAVRYLAEIRSRQPRGPYYLGGYCMGGAVAYEMAQRLHQQGETVAFLGMFDTYNHSGIAQRRRTLGERLSYVRQKYAFHWANFIHLSPAERRGYLAQKWEEIRERELARAWIKLGNLAVALRLRQGKPEPEEFLEDVNDAAGYAYRPAPYPGKITVFRYQRQFSFYSDPHLGWKGLPAGGLELVEIPVNPGGMFVEPYVRILADKLLGCMAAAEGGR